MRKIAPEPNGLRNGSVRLLAGMFAVVTLLSSCFAVEPPVGGASIRSAGSVLEIAVCSEISMARGKVEFRQVDVANEWIDGWTFDVGETLAANTILSMDPAVTPLFPADSRQTIPLTPSTDIVVRIESADDASQAYVFADFVVPEGGLPMGGWLQQGGTITESPCG